MALFGRKKRAPAFVRPSVKSDEFIRGATQMQMVNLSKPDALRHDGHLTGAGDPARDFDGWPCWLRYERDGFYVDYADGQPSWKVEPLPANPILGVCDGNGFIQIHMAEGGVWAYDSLRQAKYFESAPLPHKEHLFGPDAPYSEIHMTDPEHVAWVKAQKNPNLWHLAAMAVLAYCGDEHGFLDWLVEQPEMDAGTAAWIFLYSEGAEHLRGNGDALVDYAGNPVKHVLDALCRRSEEIGFHNDNIGIDEGFEKERQKCLNLINDGGVAQGVVIPYALLSGAMGPHTRAYENHLEDGVILA